MGVVKPFLFVRFSWLCGFIIYVVGIIRNCINLKLIYLWFLQRACFIWYFIVLWFDVRKSYLSHSLTAPNCFEKTKVDKKIIQVYCAVYVYYVIKGVKCAHAQTLYQRNHILQGEKLKCSGISSNVWSIW